MALLLGLIVISLAGIATVFWLLKNEAEPVEVSPSAFVADYSPHAVGISTRKPPEEKSLGNENKGSPKPARFGKLTVLLKKKKEGKGTAATGSKPSPSLFKSLLDKIIPGNFSLRKKEHESNVVPEATQFASLREYFGDENKGTTPGTGQTGEVEPRPTLNIASAKMGTASIKTSPAVNPIAERSLSENEEKNIEKEIELSTELAELKVKSANLETMLKEKNTALETAQESLDNELKNRKGFNKIKDVLERELKDAKDKSRNIQVELTNAQSDEDRQTKRITILEDKIIRLEKNLLEKDDKIDELVKRLQTFASPSTATVPPVKEPAVSQETPPNVTAPDSPPVPPSPGIISVPQAEKAAGEPDSAPSHNEAEQSIEKPAQEKSADILFPPDPANNDLQNPPQEEESSQPEPLYEPLSTPPEDENPAYNDGPQEQPDNEPFLKLQPDILKDPHPTVMPDQAANPAELILPPEVTKVNDAIKPPKEKVIFKIIDPDNLSGSNDDPIQTDETNPNEKE